jgi:hypothetical protein
MHAAPKSAPFQMDAESRLLALLGPRETSDLSPQSGPKRTFDQAYLAMCWTIRLPTTGAAELSSARRYLVEKLFEQATQLKRCPFAAV